MHLMPFEIAREKLLAQARRVKGEDYVPLAYACGRVLTAPICSAINVPPWPTSTMDGYAVRVQDITQSGVRLPVSQRIAAGTKGGVLQAQSIARIFTGAPIPDGADAVVMQEDCLVEADGTVQINVVPEAGAWLRGCGEDIATGAEILSAGTLLSPQAIGLAASIGIEKFSVLRKLSVGVFTTGDELVEPGQPLRQGAIYNSNRYMLCALLENLCCKVEYFGIIPDELEATRTALRRAAALCDIVISTGGVSVGEEDHVRAALEKDGELTLWSVAMKPGKPLAFGRLGTTDFIGLPGNPVSVFVVFLLLAKPFIRCVQGVPDRPPRACYLPAGFEWHKAGTRREFLRGRIQDDGTLAIFPNQSSGVLSSTLWADGVIDLAAGKTFSRNDLLPFLSWSELMK